jgi:hypothetical protein
MADNDIEDDVASEEELTSLVYVPDGREDQVYDGSNPEHDDEEAFAQMNAALAESGPLYNTDRFGSAEEAQD